jgi:flavin-dependent dehydrogenase
VSDKGSSSAPSWDYDVAVVGGGPGGAAAAAALAGRGRSVVILEREEFPRFHIGESLLPESNALLEQLGVKEEIDRQGFVRKRGATFIREDGSGKFRFDFADAPAVPDPWTYHVPRAAFDKILLDHATRRGAELLAPATAEKVSIDADGVTLGCKVGAADRSIRVGVVLDASGRAGFLGHRLKLRQQDDALRKFALFGHFRNVPREDGVEGGDIRIVVRDDLGWFWFIPLPDGLTSVGIVMDHQEGAKVAGGDPATLLADWIARTPAAAALMQDAELAGSARFEGNYSYGTRAYADRRWMLLGDAGSFIDPVFSTGVLLGLRAGLEATEAVDASLKEDTGLLPAAIKRYSDRQRRRYKYYRRFVLGFYRPGFREVFFTPEGWPAGARAITTVLAGNDRPPFSVAWKLQLFYLFTAIHECVRRSGKSFIVPVLAKDHAGAS